MEKIDWDKAPEGATHFTPACDADGTNAVFWRVIEGSVVNAWAVFKSGDLKEISINRLLDLSRPDILARPSPAWSGEGLPPVGVVCEWREKTGFQWVSAEVLFISKSSVVMRRADGFEWQMMTARTVFRPIRTPEQIAADEREAAIEQIVSAYEYKEGTCTHKLMRDQAARFYDAGLYRKP